jgi:uncharacterized protein
LSAPEITDRPAILSRVAETLAFATVGGVTFGLLGMPAGWLSGAILVVATASLAGRPLLVPVFLTRLIYVLIGISLGAVVTPATLHGMATYPLSIIGLVVAMTTVWLVGAAYLRSVHGWDKASAYLAASPGGLSQILVVAAEVGADLRAIAIVQTIRVVIIAVGLPAGLALFGLVGKAARAGGAAANPAQLSELAILIAASVAAAIIAYRIRFPGGLLFGAMLASGFLHGSGLIHAVMPWWVANTAMIAMGAITGSRFANTPLRLLADFIAAAFGSFAVAVAIVAIFAIGLISVLSLHIADVMIAFAPGSVDAMMLLALALHLDPVYVGAHHLMRVILVSMVIPLVARQTAQADGVPHAPMPPSERPPFQD